MVSVLRLMAVVGIGLLALGTLHRELGELGGDNAQYILLAQSLATGQGFRSIQTPGAPLHTQYPFGFPLLLSPIVALWGPHAYLPMHGMVIGWGLLCLFLWARWAREEEPAPGVGLATVACISTTPLWVYSYGQILSEFPYVAFSLCAFLAIRRDQAEASGAASSSRSHRPPRWVPLFLALLAGYFTRSVGITLIFSVIGWLAWRMSLRATRSEAKQSLRASEIASGAAHPRNDGRHLLLLIVGLLLPILAWHGRNSSIAQGSAEPYLRIFQLADPYQPDLGPLNLSGIGLRLVGNISAGVTTLGRELVWPTTLAAPWVASCAGGILAALIAAGFARRLPSRCAAEWYTACYLLLILHWPFQEGRFLLPILPWLWLYLLKGMALLKRAGRLILVGLVAGNIAGCAWVVGLNLAGIHYAPVLRGFVEANDWIRANTPPEAVILSRKPTLTALMAERRAVLFPYTKDEGRIWEEMRRNGVTHVLMDGIFPETRRYLFPAIRNRLDRFEPDARKFGPTVLLTVRDGT